MPGRRTVDGVALLCAFCALLSLSVYTRAFDNPFRQDDFRFLSHVEANTFRDTLKPATGFAFYRPGALALFSLEHAWFGRHSGAYIAFNYVLHVMVSILMVFVLSRLGLDRRVALLASGLFLLGFGHYGKQVMWACTSGSLGAALLSLAAILVTLRWVQSTPRAEGGRLKGVWQPAAAFLLLVASATLHEGSLVVCFLIAFLVYTRSGSRSMRKHAVWFLAPIPAMLASWFVLSEFYPVYGTLGESMRAPSWVPMVSIQETVISASQYLPRYLGFMVLPVQPTALIAGSALGRVVMESAPYFHLVIGTAMLAGLLYLVLRRKGVLRVLGLWLPLALLPFAFVAQPARHLELRYLYNASIPFCALTAMGVWALWAHARRIHRVTGGAVVVWAVVVSVALQLMLEKRYDRWTVGTSDTRLAAEAHSSQARASTGLAPILLYSGLELTPSEVAIVTRRLSQSRGRLPK